jgi:Asp-tRNA(Asn)/Glu-tRNA(Gln) amidotransferase A subunit family amidase
MLSRSGVVPFAPYFDTPGPMAKDVKSLAILMDVMCARDDEDVKSEFGQVRSDNQEGFKADSPPNACDEQP